METLDLASTRMLLAKCLGLLGKVEKTGAAWRETKQSVGQWWNRNKDTVAKVAIGVAAVAVVVGATVLTGGIAAGVMGMVGAGTMTVGAATLNMAIVGAAYSGITAMATTAATKTIQHHNSTGSWDGAAQVASKAAIETLPEAMVSGAISGGAGAYHCKQSAEMLPRMEISTDQLVARRLMVVLHRRQQRILSNYMNTSIMVSINKNRSKL